MLGVAQQLFPAAVSAEEAVIEIESYQSAAFNDNFYLLVGQRAHLVMNGARVRMACDKRRVAEFAQVIEAPVAQMRHVGDYAQLLHFRDKLPAPIGKAAALIAAARGSIFVIPCEGYEPQSALIELFEPLKAADSARALHGEHNAARMSAHVLGREYRENVAFLFQLAQIEITCRVKV